MGPKICRSSQVIRLNQYILFPLFVRIIVLPATNSVEVLSRLILWAELYLSAGNKVAWHIYPRPQTNLLSNC